MTQDLQELLAALREELKQYGEMLTLLDQQERAACSTTPQASFHATAALQRQAELVLAARRLRETRRRSLARELRQAEDATIFQLMPLLPPQFRPLLQSLVEENNDLFQSVQRAARGNHDLLNRSAQSMARFLELLFPADDTVAA
jgi:flagellar biosynthesis/type III secretory pathway chaperone